MALGMSNKEVASLANLAGGLVCEEVGVVPIDINRLAEEAGKL
jgi:bifunctional ADP-heptose synthase (sugar kinase/adenylyltransferase)